MDNKVRFIPDTLFNLKTILKISLIYLSLSLGFQGYGQTPFTCEGQLFLTLEPNNAQQLVQISIDPFSNETVFSTINDDLGVQVNAIGYRITDNLIYGIDPTRYHLYRIDALGNVEVLTTLNLNSDFFYFAGDVSQDGNYLMIIGSDKTEGGSRNSLLVRIDLRDPSYSFTVSQMNGAYPIFDIAFDPTSGTLFGYISGLQNSLLVTINPNTGAITRRYPFNRIRSAAGLFFDAFGNLYAYGGEGNNNTMYRVNKETGQFSFYAAGTEVENADASSCPYTIEIIKTVSPEVAVPCAELEYTFKIANGSGRSIEGIDFYDELPPGFTLLSIISNPYVGTIDASVQPNALKIDDMVIPIGVDSIVILVEVGNIDPGIYANQALLTDLPIDLGDDRVSDNPNTPAEDDSTKVQILGVVGDTFKVDLVLCHRDQLILDASRYGLEYMWSTGAESSQIQTLEGGQYTAIAWFGCDTNYVEYNVLGSEITVSWPGDDIIDIKLGETVDLLPMILNTGNTTIPLWTDPLTNSLSCADCIQTTAYPFFNAVYNFTAENELGCMDSIQVAVRVDKTRDIFVPNVFTPNNDGTNDFFFLQSSDFAIIKTFRIFNRWGDKVYDKGAPSNIESSVGWDGSYRGQKVDAAVFVWTAEIEFLDGLVEVFSGDVTVLK